MVNGQLFFYPFLPKPLWTLTPQIGIIYIELLNNNAWNNFLIPITLNIWVCWSLISVRLSQIKNNIYRPAKKFSVKLMGTSSHGRKSHAFLFFLSWVMDRGAFALNLFRRSIENAPLFYYCVIWYITSQYYEECKDIFKDIFKKGLA